MILLVSFEKLLLDAPWKLQHELNRMVLDFSLLTNKPTDRIHHGIAKRRSVDLS
jgi:hypothetical protein